MNKTEIVPPGAQKLITFDTEKKMFSYLIVPYLMP